MFYSYRQGLQRLFSPPRVQKTKRKQLCPTTRFHRQRAHRTARVQTSLFYSYRRGLQPPNDKGTNGSLLIAEGSNGPLPLPKSANGKDSNGSLLQLVSRPQLQQLSSTAKELKQQVAHTAGAQPARAPTALFCSYYAQRLSPQCSRLVTITTGGTFTHSLIPLTSKLWARRSASRRGAQRLGLRQRLSGRPDFGGRALSARMTSPRRRAKHQTKHKTARGAW